MSNHPHHRRHRRHRHRPRRGRRAHRRRDDRRRARSPARTLLGHGSRGIRRHASSTRPASTSSPAASTPTPTWSCRSAAPTPPTRSRPAPAPRPGAARRSIIDFAVQTLRRAGRRTASPPGTRRPAGNCAIDYGFHQIIGGVDEDSLKAMDGLIDEGITSFKLFMAYPGVFYSDDAQILKAMQKSRRDRAAHDDARRERPGDRRARRSSSSTQGKTDPYYHGIARAWQMEEEATHRAIMLAEPHRRAALRRARQREAGRRAARLGARQGPERVRRDLPAVPLPLARGAARRHRARSGASSRARSGSARRRCAPAPRATRTTCGRRCAPTTCRWSRPTTARSA